MDCAPRRVALNTTRLDKNFCSARASIEGEKDMVKNRMTACCVLLESYVGVIEDEHTGEELEEEVGSHCVLVVGGDLLGPNYVTFDPWGLRGGEVSLWQSHSMAAASPLGWVQLSLPAPRSMEGVEGAEEVEVEDESLASQLSRAMGVGKEADLPDQNGSNTEVKVEDAGDAKTDGDVQAQPAKLQTTEADAGPEVVPAAEDQIDDIVPFICYDEEKGSFSKDDRWILPKRNQFPLIFCALRVRIRLEPIEPSGGSANPWNLTAEQVEVLLRKLLGLGDLLVRFDDCRDRIDAVTNARELIAALKADLPAGLCVGDVKEVSEHQMLATVVNVLETSDDMDPERISSLAVRLKEGGSCDSIVLELPQIWIISDPDFRAKTASIGLYPGSFWMGFLKSWGAVKIAEVFFRKVDPDDKRREPTVTVAVQFRERENLKMCFTFLYDRYLVHPKQKNALRQPWCKLADFEEFKAKTLGKPVPSRPKAAAPDAGKLKINQPTKQHAASPVPKATAAEAKAAKAEDFDRQLTPAE
ncbi:unnamed protein product, partial [Symbiodinium necroappetens]